MSNQNNSGGGLSHEKVETSNFLMIVLILLATTTTKLSRIDPCWKETLEILEISIMKVGHFVDLRTQKL